MSKTDDTKVLRQIAAALQTGEAIRLDFGRGERLHIDRPMPFICVHVGRRREPAARNIVTASSAYLLVGSLTRATAIIDLVGQAMRDRFGAFIVLDIGELDRDRLAGDADYLPPFEISLSALIDPEAQSARATFAAAADTQ